MPSTTFVVAAHNAASTISEALESILGQTRPTWNAIVVDDGSTDTTVDEVKRYLRDPRVRLLSRPSGGVSSARNAGTAMANTPWLVFMDADDLILPDYLAEMQGYVQGGPGNRHAAVYCSTRRLLPDGRLGDIHRPPETNHFPHLLNSNIFYSLAIMLSKDVFQSLGGFREDLIAGEDWDLWIRLARSGRAIGEVNKALAIYRMRPGSLTRDPAPMLSSLVKVIAEAHDLAISDLPPGDAAGRAQLEQAKHRTLFAISMWCYGITFGTGRPDRSLVIAPDRTADADPRSIANSFVEGVAHGACGFRSDWARLWSLYESEIARDFCQLGAEESAEFWTACLSALSEIATTTKL